MASNNFYITFDIEPIVKLTCLKFNCRFNGTKSSHPSPTCQLKEIEIGSLGDCQQYEHYPFSNDPENENAND